MNSQRIDSSQANILIVDDKPANLQLLSKMLAEQGYRVRPVPNGQMALSAAQAELPDLVLLDIKMPDIDGYSICEQLKTEEKTCEIPIIFISALDAIQDKVKAFRAGGVDYITKPFQIEEVLARVDTHLTLRKLQTQFQEANQKMAAELALAGEVQASFLSRELPKIDRWQLTVSLQSSRETSGDFYDIKLLPNGRLGVLVADVVDKGAGAALFMALSWTLFQTYASDFLTQPELVLSAVNNRILENTKTKQYVTAFYGILETDTGNLVYCNAGHCPPFLFRHNATEEVEQLIRTGVPVGIFEDQTWSRGTCHLEPGDVLMLYSDGVTEAQNADQAFFGEERLIKSIRSKLGNSALEIHDGLMYDLKHFTGETPQSDDIVLSILRRNI
jgi:sigma-B regulation protein RsbU (phosphoserine phosphatase)